MTIVIYGSQYGTTKVYAKELANRISADLKSYDEIDDISKYDTIVYLGALYAGGVLGMKKTFMNVTDCEKKK